jgi:hypothetical protein
MSKEDQERMVNDLEELMFDFEGDEIPSEKIGEVSLEDPVLLLLAQYRSFRICRNEFFFPESDCRPY